MKQEMNVQKLFNRTDQLKKQYFTHKPAICLENAKSRTEVFKETEGEPIIIRRAKAIRRHCQSKTINIQDHELIIGNAGFGPRTACICPELSNHWLGDELDTVTTRPQDPYLITEDQKRLFREEIEPYWRGKTISEHWKARVPAKTLAIAYKTGIIDADLKNEGGPGEIAPAYEELLLPKGYGGLKKEAEAALATADMTLAETHQKVWFWQSVNIVCEAMEILAHRHAEKAMEMASRESNPIRRRELENMALVCDWVAANPPRTFHEALQLIWFSQIALYMEANAPSYSPGRMDQYMYPFYKTDCDQGILDKEGAKELLECLWVKLAEQIWYQTENSAKYFAGYTAFQNLCVGGITPNGRDAVNELSYMILDTTARVQLCQPSLSVRINRKNPEQFFRKVAQVTRLGTGFPAIHNDDIGIKMLMKKGVSAPEARNWCIVGCVEPNLPGKLSQWSSNGHYNLASAVEFVLTNGVHLKSGRQLGLQTGNPCTFKSYEEFETAVITQIKDQIRHYTISSHIIETLHQELLPMPLASSLMLNCIEKGKDLMHGGDKYTIGPGTNGIGAADLTNSLAAIKKLVFDEKKIGLDELIKAIKADFKGHEQLQQRLVNEAPKWGNDDDQADEILVNVMDTINEFHHGLHGILGSELMPSYYPVSSNVPQGHTVCALPSGRNAYRPLADGCSPCQGTDFLGPTAVFKSMSKLNCEDADGGLLLNMKFNPVVFEGEAGITRLVSLIRSFLDLGLYHVQFNVVTTKTLKLAQNKPDEYKSLLIRVAGYSAYFVELSKDIQDDIINRTQYDAFN
ncbi:MAG: glycyl radical protein [Spirochaetales bacterium]|jgi:pyruvate formate-lyase/glycerol dehydratase family glycyl radical enzyme|nr:glycyl radical protein [Spirochaetales bacterium]